MSYSLPSVHNISAVWILSAASWWDCWGLLFPATRQTSCFQLWKPWCERRWPADVIERRLDGLIELFVHKWSVKAEYLGLKSCEGIFEGWESEGGGVRGGLQAFKKCDFFLMCELKDNYRWSVSEEVIFWALQNGPSCTGLTNCYLSTVTNQLVGFLALTLLLSVMFSAFYQLWEWERDTEICK